MKKLLLKLCILISMAGFGQKYTEYNQSIIKSDVLSNFNTKNKYCIVMDSLESENGCIGACKQYLLTLSNYTDPNTEQQGVVVSKISIGENNPEEFGQVVWSKLIKHIDVNRNLEALYINSEILINVGAWDGVTPYDYYFVRINVNSGDLQTDGELNTTAGGICIGHYPWSNNNPTYIANFGSDKGYGRLILPQNFNDPLNYYSRPFDPMNDNSLFYSLGNKFIKYATGFIQFSGTSLSSFNSSSSQSQFGTGFYYREGFVNGNTINFFTSDATSNQHIQIYDWIYSGGSTPGYIFGGKNLINNKAVYFKVSSPENGFNVEWAYEIDWQGVACLHLVGDEVWGRNWLRFSSTNLFTASEVFNMALIDENGLVIREIYSDTEFGDDNFSGILLKLPFVDEFFNHHYVAIENGKLFQFNMDWENCNTINYDSTITHNFNPIDISKISFTTTVGQFEPAYNESTNSINPTLTNNLTITDNDLQISSFCETLVISKKDYDKIKCYPNPTFNSITLSTNNIINMNYTLVDLQGKVVLRGKIESSEQMVDISHLTEGLYILVFEDESIPVISVIKK